MVATAREVQWERNRTVRTIFYRTPHLSRSTEVRLTSMGRLDILRLRPEVWREVK